VLQEGVVAQETLEVLALLQLLQLLHPVERAAAAHKAAEQLQ
jgi:hypothetical protein